VDLAAVQAHRPAYAFWQYLFTVPDGRILLGSGKDGRLLALLPEHGDWLRDAKWEEPSLQELIAGQPLPERLDDRRTELVRLLEPSTGPLISNPSRGNFLLPNIPRFGGFLAEWATIYERFGIPGEIGLAQAILESGLDGRVRSRANALGFCQFLKRNWEHLNRLTPHKMMAVLNLGPVSSVDATPDGQVWVGTPDALVEFSGGDIAGRRDPRPLVGAPLGAMHADERGALWVATNRNLLRLADGEQLVVPLGGSFAGGLPAGFSAGSSGGSSGGASGGSSGGGPR